MAKKEFPSTIARRDFVRHSGGKTRVIGAATNKAVNYTPEQTANMKAAYVENPTMETVESLAAAMGKTARSVVAKLSREGVYKPKEYKRKDGKPAEKKDETAEAIGSVLGLSEGEVTSLAKANRSALQKVFAALANSRPL